VSGELAASRGVVVAALEAVGLEVKRPGQPVPAPGAIIRPGDPWLTPSRVGGAGTRTVAWSVILVAGRIDVDGLPELERLAELAAGALDRLAGHSTPRTARAVALDLAGGTYLTAELAPVETLVRITED
jgi:hypothetical protein